MDLPRGRLARLLGFALALAAPFATRAQPSRPAPIDVESTAGALTLEGTLERSGSHGCSQSFASSSDLAAMRLLVTADGRATLIVETQHHDTFGPSPGRYAEGERDFVTTTELARSTLTGRATASANGLVLRFDRLADARVRFSGYGTLPLPVPTETPVTYALRCELARTDVLPKEPRENERPTPHTLLRCTPEGTIAALSAFESPTPTFGRAHGVRIVSTQEMWAYETTTVIRATE